MDFTTIWVISIIFNLVAVGAMAASQEKSVEVNILGLLFSFLIAPIISFLIVGVVVGKMLGGSK